MRDVCPQEVTRFEALAFMKWPQWWLGYQSFIALWMAPSDGYAVSLSSLFVGSLDGYAVRLSSLFVGSIDGYAVRLSSLFDGSLDGYAVDFRPLWNDFYDRSRSSLLWNGSIDDYVMRFYRDQGRRLFARPLAVLRFRWFVGHLRHSKGVANRGIVLLVGSVFEDPYFRDDRKLWVSCKSPWMS